ncbi:transglycosylase domain-containing protein [Tenuibacillus multivorans]|uniref:Penicillin-binding protein n=1 Tax=Tenuibacillus multivorans TaxID=237069 RepID=A0A1H0EFW8_9BACI|nr:transglycosylase domain-containing protein [Tenuibacillus multivorans]GEL77176.1 hypothetical protein TMU01_14110 [Tenuibacillus multivorans]SDN81228.1 penicillin-binding protein [Tenuibacillus multivorans]
MDKNEFRDKWLSYFQKGKFLSSTRITLDVMWHIALFFIIIGLVAMFFLGGLGFGYFASLVQGLPDDGKEEMRKQIYNYEETSNIYFANNVHMGELRSDLHREEVTLDNVSENVKNAIIATEDEYFKTHNGIVPKAIMRALYQEFSNAEMQSGGSTLTQQLIKSQILTNEVSFERKAKEILIALRLENFFEKDEIFEAYLNIVPFGRDSSGRNIAGIQSAAQGLFDVDASELNLAQAAYIAGMPQSPIAYTPFKNNGEVKSEENLQPGLDRQYVVLSRMLDEGMINQQEFDEALNYDVIGNLTDKKESTIIDYPFLTFEIESRAIDIMTEQLAIDDGYTLDEINNNSNLREQYRILAERDLRQRGYNIHTTINKEIYDKFQEVTEEYSYFNPTKYVTRIDPNTGEQYQKEEPVETGAYLMENQTGRIIAFVGGRDHERSQINHMSFHIRPNGSTMKPLFGYAPAMEEGVIQPGSPIPDVKFEYVDTAGNVWTPSNYIASLESGIESARQALFNSHNLPAGRLAIEMAEQGVDSTEYLEKMGFSNVTPDDAPPANILGSKYVTVEENTNAFATFANDGKFIDGYMIERIEDGEGNVIFEHEVEETEVFSPQTAYLTVDILRDVLTQGTGTYLRSQLNHPYVDWAGKTGTTNYWMDSWFVGTNPNVTLGTWIGYDTYDVDGDGFVSENERRNYMNLRVCRDCALGYSSRNQGYWAQLANVATEINPELMAPEERFESPGGIVTRSYCQLSGKLPSEMCEDLGLVKTDLFNVDYVPTERDNSVIEGQYVQIGENYYQAAEQTPVEFVEEGHFLRPGFIEEKGWDNITDLSKLLPDNEAWANLIVPEEEPPEDDGAPPAPTGLTIENNSITWNSVETDVIGYRIYMASSEDGEFQRVDSTKETTALIPLDNRQYAISAVDFYGQESELSDPVTFGDLGLPVDQEEDEEDEEENDNDENNDDSNDNNGNGDNNDNGNDNGTGNGNENGNNNGNGNENNNDDDNQNNRDLG